MTNYAQDLRGARATLQEENNTLSERLRQLEEYRASNPPEKMFAERVKGMNPLKALDSWFNVIATGQGIRSDRTANANQIIDIGGKLEALAKANEPSPSELLSGITQGYDWKDGKWVPTSGLTALKGQDAVKQVQKEGGSALLNIAKTKTERESLAETILSFGSVADYKAQANLEEVMNKDEYDKFKTGAALLEDINTLQSYFPRGTDTAMNIFGGGNLTGPITGSKGPLRNTKQVTVQALISDLATKKVKELSGVAVSPQEFERLKPLLPGATDQENEVADKLDALQRRVAMNLEAKEAAARAGMDPVSYWNKNKDTLLMKYGFPSETGEAEVVGGSNGSGLDDIDEQLINKYKNTQMQSFMGM